MRRKLLKVLSILTKDDVTDSLSKRVIEWIDSFGDPLTLYREIVLKEDEKLDIMNLGTYWTPIKEKAHSPYGKEKEGEKILLEAEVNREDVDEFGTIANMRRYPDEKEITLRRGAKIKLKDHGLGRI